MINLGVIAMNKARKAVAALAALSVLAFGAVALASDVGESISAAGQSLKTSEGTWELTADGKTASGFAVRLNGKAVGYATSLTVGKNGMPIAKHANGVSYVWTGSTFKKLE
jgi:hypothetical protein